jgi:hypothetical protein
MGDKKIILHLCADIGSDSYQYYLDDDYLVVKIGKLIGVENVSTKNERVYIGDFAPFPIERVAGIIANPPCTEFSTARADGKARENEIGYTIVDHCIRIKDEINPEWWVLENPARGTLKNYLGDPKYKYEPWHYGSPWTKQTALWGEFNIPEKIYTKWEDVRKNNDLYVRPGRPKPSLAFLHKSAIKYIPEFFPFIESVDSDMSFRSLCSQGFARSFKAVNR